jgi:membrane-associated phospholipid phosphatase
MRGHPLPLSIPRRIISDPRRSVVVVVAGAAGLWLSSWFDMPVAAFAARHPLTGGFDFLAMCRLAGYLPVWVVVGAAFALIDSARGWRGLWPRGGLLVASVTVAGGAAEVLKILVRRERPMPPFTDYSFRPWEQDTWSSGGLGWPSSHVAVAFAAVWVLWRLHPRARAVWLLLGCACAWSRLAFNDHYLSDVAGAVFVAHVVVQGLASLPLVSGHSGAGESSGTAPNAGAQT